MKTLSLTGTLFAPEKAKEICDNLNKEESGKRMYAPLKVGNNASIEVFDSEGYSIGFL